MSNRRHQAMHGVESSTIISSATHEEPIACSLLATLRTHTLKVSCHYSISTTITYNEIYVYWLVCTTLT